MNTRGAKTRRAVVLKLSGEALGKHRPLDGHAVDAVCRQIVDIAEAGIRVGVVVGGGNFIRGSEVWAGSPLPREVLDTWGMRGTVFNAQALQDHLQATSALSVLVVAKPGPASACVPRWTREAVSDPSAQVVIVGGGLGQFGISTDVAAPELARDMGSRLIVMAKHGVDYIHASDPNRIDHRLPRPDPILELTADEALERGLRVMDHEAIKRCRDYGITVQVVGADGSKLREAILDDKRIGSVMRPGRRVNRKLRPRLAS